MKTLRLAPIAIALCFPALAFPAVAGGARVAMLD